MATQPLPGMRTQEYVAAVMQVSVRTVQRWIKRGEMRAVRIGGVVRIPISELANLGLPPETLRLLEPADEEDDQ